MKSSCGSTVAGALPFTFVFFCICYVIVSFSNLAKPNNKNKNKKLTLYYFDIYLQTGKF